MKSITLLLCLIIFETISCFPYHGPVPSEPQPNYGIYPIQETPQVPFDDASALEQAQQQDPQEDVPLEDQLIKTINPNQSKNNPQISYNTFFPVMLGGYGGSPFDENNPHQRQNFGQGNYPGSATAIANSFHVGKGGIANSRAVSFGDPNQAMRKQYLDFFQ